MKYLAAFAALSAAWVCGFLVGCILAADEEEEVGDHVLHIYQG